MIGDTELRALIAQMSEEFPDVKAKAIKEYVADALASRSVQNAVAECIDQYLHEADDDGIIEAILKK